MKKTILLAILLCVSFMLFVSAHLCAQTVSNVVAKQVGNTIEITYDIDRKANVSLLLSQDGGKTYAAIPKTVTGVGLVSAGKHKMVWSMLKDGQDWDIPRARFKVEVLDRLVFTVRDVSFTMIYVAEGTFTMGCTLDQGADCPWKNTHEVTVDEYFIGQTEITQELWQVVMGNNPSLSKYEQHPVENVSWNDCQEFVKRLNLLLATELGSRRFALPTEEQWEYAARGGHKQPPYQFRFSGSDIIGSVGWYYENSRGYTHIVGKKAANTLGVYDMTGNVWEWCLNEYNNNKNNRVRRGGACNNPEKNNIIAWRSVGEASNRDGTTGLRLVCY